MDPAHDAAAVPFASVAPAPPALPRTPLVYTFAPNLPPRLLVRAGLFLGGLLLGVALCALSVVVLFNLGPGISIASILARLIAITLLVAPIIIGRIGDRRLRTGAVLFGTLIPVSLAAIYIIPNAILM